MNKKKSEIFQRTRNFSAAEVPQSYCSSHQKLPPKNSHCKANVFSKSFFFVLLSQFVKRWEETKHVFFPGIIRRLVRFIQWDRVPGCQWDPYSLPFPNLGCDKVQESIFLWIEVASVYKEDSKCHSSDTFSRSPRALSSRMKGLRISGFAWKFWQYLGPRPPGWQIACSMFNFWKSKVLNIIQSPALNRPDQEWMLVCE